MGGGRRYNIHISCQGIVSSLTYWRKFVPTEQPMIPGLLGAHLAGDGEAVVLAVLVVTLNVKVGEVDGDPHCGGAMISQMQFLLLG